jgi:aldehyde dehydrogenase (NAD+)
MPAIQETDVSTVRYEHWINGEAVPPGGGDYLESTSPLDDRLVARIARGDADDVARAVSAAAAAQPGWASRSPKDRARVLVAVAAGIRAEAGSLVRLEIAETGKLRARAAGEIEMAADYFDFYASAVRALHDDAIDLGPDQHVFTRREPFGVVGLITPWNAPVTQAARAIAPALAMGNATVVKPSEFTSCTTLELARIATTAGLGAGLLNVVTGLGPDTGTPLVRDPGVSRVAFTGSVVAGRVVAKLAAERLIPVTLELGGKSPHIIFADADLDAAVNVAARAFTDNGGQVCSAGTRLLVERAVHDRVVAGIVDIVARLRPDRDLPPIITPAQYEKVASYLELARKEGVTVVTGGTAVASDDGGNRHIWPTVLTGVTNDMRVAREEIFGPVLGVLPFDTEEEAIAIANDTSFGLVSGVWTRDIDRAFRVAARLEAGQVFVNDWTANVEVAFGGYKESGYGREKGVEALSEYSRVKSVLIRIKTHS